MDSQTYIRKMAETESPAIDAVRNSMDDIDSIRFLHVVLGISSELTELRQEMDGSIVVTSAMIGEVGDLWWYTALGLYTLGHFSFEIPDHRRPSVDKCLWHVECASEVLTSMVKAHIFYGRELNRDEINSKMFEIAAALTVIGDYLGMAKEEMWDANIAKLKERFDKGKFTEEDANTRDTDSEFKAIKGHM